MAPASGDDDDPADDWKPGDRRDTSVEFDATDLAELEADATTPTVGPESLAGYELGRQHERAACWRQWEDTMAAERRHGKAIVLQELRDELTRQGMRRAFVDAFVARLAANVGVKLG